MVSVGRRWRQPAGPPLAAARQQQLWGSALPGPQPTDQIHTPRLMALARRWPGFLLPHIPPSYTRPGGGSERSGRRRLVPRRTRVFRAEPLRGDGACVSRGCWWPGERRSRSRRTFFLLLLLRGVSAAFNDSAGHRGMLEKLKCLRVLCSSKGIPPPTANRNLQLRTRLDETTQKKHHQRREFAFVVRV